MIEYFKSQTIKDFKNSKRFWQFYSAHVQVKSDKTAHTLPSSMHNGNKTASTPSEIANLFNKFFTSLSSESNASFEESCRFATDNVQKMLDKMNIFNKKFYFHPTTATIVEKTIKSIDNCSPGISGVPLKIFKLLTPAFIQSITNLFNDSLNNKDMNRIPIDLKTAIVTALHKGKKLDLSDVNSYREY